MVIAHYKPFLMFKLKKIQQFSKKFDFRQEYFIFLAEIKFISMKLNFFEENSIIYQEI